MLISINHKNPIYRIIKFTRYDDDDDAHYKTKVIISSRNPSILGMLNGLKKYQNSINKKKRVSLTNKQSGVNKLLKLWFYRFQHPGITGLKNLGNSCYMNSIIQCLSNTDYLAKYFNGNSYANDLNRNSDKGVTVAEEVAQVIKALWRGQYKSISPRDLKVCFKQKTQKFRVSVEREGET